MSKAAKRPAVVPSGALVREVTILNKFGIHARPAALFVKTASRFVSEIQVENNGVVVSAKSIMGLLTIEGYQGVVLRLIAVGPDAAAALDALVELVQNKFFED